MRLGVNVKMIICNYSRICDCRSSLCTGMTGSVLVQCVPVQNCADIIYGVGQKEAVVLRVVTSSMHQFKEIPLLALLTEFPERCILLIVDCFILCTCLSRCVWPHDLHNCRCALTLFAVFQGKVVTFSRYAANVTCIFLEIL